jgi:hypothetical protein
MSLEGIQVVENTYFEPPNAPTAMRRNRAWNNVVDDKLSKEQQFSFGARLAFLKYNSKFEKGSTPNDAFLVIRNPEQTPNNMVRHAFGQMIQGKDFIPKLYDMLKRKAYDKEDISDDKILKFVMDNIPDTVFDNLKEYYDKHLENQIASVKPQPNETQEQTRERAIKTAKKDFFNLVMFQLVNSQLVDYCKKVNNIDDKPTPEQMALNSNIPKVLKNVCAVGGKIEYDEKGKLTKVENGGFGADIPLLDMMIERFEKAKPPGSKIEEDEEVVKLVTESVDLAKEEYKRLELTETYGEYLANDITFMEAVESKDPEQLNEQFKNVLELYSLGDAFGTTEKQNNEVFKNIVNKFVELGCPSAIYYKGQALMGNKEDLGLMHGFEAPVLFARDVKPGLDLLAKLKDGDKLVKHENSPSMKTSWDHHDVEKVKSQQEAISRFIDSLPNVYDNYKGSSKYPDMPEDKRKVKQFLGHLAHKHFSDPKRENQIKLLQGIIDDKKLSPEEKAATLLGAIDAIKNQIGVTKFESRLITVMNKIEEGLKESSKSAGYKDIKSQIDVNERTKALKSYLDTNGGSLDQKFVDKMKTEMEPKPEKGIKAKKSN